ncbi:PREDICTED: GPI mannosyltransferase 1-like [Priapulus caudatus]|uniref:GPI alpha-1,4-mannosyltransferase I, catalytic subunit n=1 Tax=Priapulus caudatus TaxID=37621 RepID=A0ABM1EQQ0_PRICU|nr:PREDICTED: GPI mannosyltransferase 1-like [Priapulus caudatus]
MVVNREAAGFYAIFAASFVGRLALVIYGDWQDRTQIVKYTDIDYFVFSDAARYVANGASPYDRPTYRYTPLLAAVLTPNVFLHPAFGKLLFIVCDVLTGWLMYRILLLRENESRQGTSTAVNVACRHPICNYDNEGEAYCNSKTFHPLFLASLWLFNPLPAVIASRGNAEAVMCALVLAVLHSIETRRFSRAAILYAIAVHVKIYPITYALPIYLHLNASERKREGRGLLGYLRHVLLPSRRTLVFAAVSVATLAALTCVNYALYGHDFLEHTYLYHVTRRDIRHNMSVYFYMLYLLAESDWSLWIGVLVFLPQAVLLIALSLRHFDSLELCWFLHTFTFVAFNKVCTSQYFLWYLCFLPLIVSRMKCGWMANVLVWSFWFLAQALWLAAAFYVEFEGRNAFLYVWMAGVLFFISNICLLCHVIAASHPPDKLKIK